MEEDVDHPLESGAPGEPEVDAPGQGDGDLQGVDAEDPLEDVGQLGLKRRISSNNVVISISFKQSCTDTDFKLYDRFNSRDFAI